MSFRHPLRAACLAPLCLIVRLAFLVAPHAAYAVGTADGYVSVGTTTNPTSEFGVYGGATIGSSYNNMLAPTNGLLVQGNVGIGTTSPQMAFQLGTGLGLTWGTNNILNFNSYYNTGAAQYQTLTSGYSAQIWQDSTGTGNLYLRVGNGNAGAANTLVSYWTNLALSPTGNVGIGTTAPQSKLQIQSGEVQVGSSGASCSAANAGAISYASGALSYCNGSAWTSAASGIGSTGYDALWTSPTAIGTGLIYESGGKVGIGTTSPGAALDVYGQAYFEAFTTIDPPSAAAMSVIIRPNTVYESDVFFKTGAAWEWKAGLEEGDTNNDYYLRYYNGSAWLPAFVAQKATGNVGIGTTSPVATLDVNGYAHLAKNSSQPIACDAAHDGSLALASTRRPCECVSSAWIDVVYGTACSW